MEPVLIGITRGELERLLQEAAERGGRLALQHVAAEHSEWMTQDDAATFLGYSRRHIVQLVHKDGLPGVKVGRNWRFKRSELNAWLERRRG